MTTKYHYIIKGKHAYPTEHFRADMPKILVWDANEKVAKIWTRKPDPDSAIGLELITDRSTVPFTARPQHKSMVSQYK